MCPGVPTMLLRGCHLAGHKAQQQLPGRGEWLPLEHFPGSQEEQLRPCASTEHSSVPQAATQAARLNHSFSELPMPLARLKHWSCVFQASGNKKRAKSLFNLSTVLNGQEHPPPARQAGCTLLLSTAGRVHNLTVANPPKLCCQHRCWALRHHCPAAASLGLEVRAHEPGKLQARAGSQLLEGLAVGRVPVPALARETLALHVTFCSAGGRGWPGGPLALSVL